MIVCGIVAMAKNRVIGKSNALPWHLPEDLKFFKQKTSGRIVIMGRKTFESIGRPLPNRVNIVLTRSKSFSAEGVEVFSDPEKALQFAQSKSGPEDEVFVIGGSEIYGLFLPKIQRLYVTEIDEDFDGDSLFPSFHDSNFTLVEKKEGTSLPRHYYCLYERR